MVRLRNLLVVVCALFATASARAEDMGAPARPAKAPAPHALGAPAQAALDDIKSSFGFVPGFLAKLPAHALPGAWQELKSLQLSDQTALPCKIKELIGLAVAAQVPCKYCVQAHTQFARLHGASEAETAEAVLMAALTRHWSTVANGFQTDPAKFKTEFAKLVAHVKKSGPPAAGLPMPGAPRDASAALQEMQQVFGSVPEFMRKFPAEGLPGAWQEMRDVEMNPNTALSGKYKSLIGLAVASQIPCQFCVVADTEFAKLEGASEREIAEAIGMAALTRHWSTFLNGMQIDEAAFKRDVDRLVKGAKRQAAAAAAPGKPERGASLPRASARHSLAQK
jgi:AhpD family alkylhydroperoxidase